MRTRDRERAERRANKAAVKFVESLSPADKRKMLTAFIAAIGPAAGIFSEPHNYVAQRSINDLQALTGGDKAALAGVKAIVETAIKIVQPRNAIAY